MFLDKRIIVHKERNITEGDFVIYWMSRDQRIDDNFCIYYGLELSKKLNKKFGILFNITPTYLEATIRQYDFMIKSLIELESNLKEIGIPFFVLFGDPIENIKNFVKEKKVSVLISDFSPLKISRKTKERLREILNVSFYEIDTHNIIPPFVASEKQEFSAFTLRKKYEKLLPYYLVEPPKIIKYKSFDFEKEKIDWEKIYNNLKVDKKVKPTKFFKPGQLEAKRVLENFIENKLDNYNINRNDPTIDGLSNLSVYLHFGMISPLRVAIEIEKSNKNLESKKAFLEELIIRRELSENFCFYNSNYDSYLGIPFWARKSLDLHLNDKREYIYNIDILKKGETHDELWNAAQKEMVLVGKMHGYMRMYWAKKVLEWTRDYKESVDILIYLNNRYELDGRDPNGYAGILWSIGGLHDRPFKERKIYGKVRYMSSIGLNKKFDTKKYIEKVLALERIS